MLLRLCCAACLLLLYHVAYCQEARISSAPLDNSYKKGDPAGRSEFLKAWEKHSREILEKRSKSLQAGLEVPQAVQDIYITLADSDLGDKGRTKYFVVQASVMVVISDEAAEGGDARLSHGNFSRLSERLPGCMKLYGPWSSDLLRYQRVLLLDELHETALLRFLSADAATHLVERPLLRSALPDALERAKFLEPDLPVRAGSWGLGWSLETAPQIELIALNAKGDLAYVIYTVGDTTVRRTMQKQAGKWKITGNIKEFSIR